MPVPRQVAASALDLIGNTPVVELEHIVSEGSARVVAKLESSNPGGSIKDRICVAMIDRAESEGRLSPGDTIIEPTSGNTGVGLALVAAARGYKLILTMPDTMSEERRRLLRAYGAELVLTPDSKGMHEAIARAQEILEDNPGYFMPGQFSNPANPETHRNTTAREILQQCPELDAFVAGVGTGGTITGVGSVLKQERSSVEVIAIEPASSPVLSGGKPGYHAIEGIGAGFVPDVVDEAVIDRVLTVSDDDARSASRRLAAEEGLLVGISSGAACAAALRVASELGSGKTVLVIFPDSGERYLTTGLYSDNGH